jgi:hypothetical protein
MHNQLLSWLSLGVGVPCAIASILQLLGLVASRRHRRVVRYRKMRVWGIAWTRLDVTDDRHP